MDKRHWEVFWNKSTEVIRVMITPTRQLGVGKEQCTEHDRVHVCIVWADSVDEALQRARTTHRRQPTPLNNTGE